MKKIWGKWKEIAVKIGDFQLKILFSILYFILLVPLGLIVNIFNDYLKKGSDITWEEFREKLNDINDMKRQ